MSDKKPRELKLSTRRGPNGPSIVYHMAECSHDLWTQERNWHFVEKLPGYVMISRNELLDSVQKAFAIIDESQINDEFAFEKNLVNFIFGAE